MTEPEKGVAGTPPTPSLQPLGLVSKVRQSWGSLEPFTCGIRHQLQEDDVRTADLQDPQVVSRELESWYQEGHPTRFVSECGEYKQLNLAEKNRSHRQDYLAFHL